VADHVVNMNRCRRVEAMVWLYLVLPSCMCSCYWHCPKRSDVPQQVMRPRAAGVKASMRHVSVTRHVSVACSIPAQTCSHHDILTQTLFADSAIFILCHFRGCVEPVGSLLLRLGCFETMRSFLLLTRLSVDPSVPLFGESVYAYGEGAVPRAKKPCTSFGIGGQDSKCPDCFREPPNGNWFIYDDPTWDFSADEPKPRA